MSVSTIVIADSPLNYLKIHESRLMLTPYRKLIAVNFPTRGWLSRVDATNLPTVTDSHG